MLHCCPRRVHENIGNAPAEHCKNAEGHQESDVNSSLRELVVQDLAAHRKNAEKYILAHQFRQLARNRLSQQTTFTQPFRVCMEAGLEIVETTLGVEQEGAPALEQPLGQEPIRDAAMAIESARLAGLLSEDTLTEIACEKERRQFRYEMNQFQNDARQMSSVKFPGFAVYASLAKSISEYSNEGKKGYVNPEKSGELNMEPQHRRNFCLVDYWITVIFNTRSLVKTVENQQTREA